MKLLVAGGCGFIGSHFIEYFLKTYPKAHITNLDCLTYAAHPDMPAHLARLDPNRYCFVPKDISDPMLKSWVKEFKFDAIVNFAAETHVDRSILDPDSFVRTNVMGVQNLLAVAREGGNIRFVHVSTDEVYGSLKPTDAPSVEASALDPNSPYAASKAAADLIALASSRTYKQPVLITRCTNNYGPYQFPEKLLPLLIANALENKSVPVYGDGLQVRDWIYVVDHCRGIDAVLQKGKSGEVYNISACGEAPNITVIKKVLDLLGKPHSLISFVGDRPAHDRRYGLDSTKIRTELGWKPLVSFEEGLKTTVDWYLQNVEWWKKVRGSDYQKYYQANYDQKFVVKNANKSEVNS
ncbi:MAG: dTDP-glucose 4,6-dehydratase [Deltaproteobacteria bacterium]|nr:dTDP-glucose 4,6-dehydratase [Deltaproteobacteria bacterium]MBM4316646.1 dTDP-glucose 4,6-dehydratase [Deltaproteobacteria bacterium]